MNQHEWNGKKVAVLGLGVEGLSSAKFLTRHGAEVTILDKKDKKVIGNEVISNLEKEGIRFVLGKNYLQNLDTYELIVRSPGVRRHIIEEALKNSKSLAERDPDLQDRKKDVLVTSQMQLFFDMCPAPIIGVTGTKGKGTTATLIYEMLKEEGLDVYVGGNIGTPPFEFLEKLQPHSWVVLELSSFQLQDLAKSPASSAGKPHIAVMLMTTSEHLDYHADVYEYVNAKRNIFRNQKSTDYAVINKDYPASRESDVDTEGQIYWVSREDLVARGCYVRQGSLFIKTEIGDEEIIATKEIRLPGEHNLENVCAAVMAARLAGVGKKAMVKVLREFQGLEHRLEFVREVGGVTYYDDSFSTVPETTIAAVQAFVDPEILILGGSSKNSDFSELGRVIRDSKNVKAIIGIGVEWSRIKEAIEYSSSKARSLNRHSELVSESKKILKQVQDDNRDSSRQDDTVTRQARTINEELIFIEGAHDMHTVVLAASKIAHPGDVVLLSPACASFDMFKNYKERGEQFKEEVRKLAAMMI